jgi:hypothetical protein
VRTTGETSGPATTTTDGLAREPFAHQPRPWALEGDVDLDYDDDTRHHQPAALTDLG